ncbi:MAG: hypothetical protein BLITH_0557 [Brockia lithotrophica]|uniref:Heme chaperone HemW n=1 Tax=Brockia lithotrophica TaxID=933949 RepID=A0A2T5G4K0_9BACL|nr:MAG: hypothetical protein BLITH_0557 [Brockia lithotrophica]
MTGATGSPSEGSAPFVHPEPARALYVHVPFCRARCAFCDFPVVSGRTEHLHGPYVDALLQELELLFSLFPPDPSRPLRTLYVGGGTPSFLARAEWERLAEGLERVAPGGLASFEEWTVELNPEDAEADLLRMLRSFGVTRVSIGVQSFDDALLAALGRVHDAARAVHAVELAAGLGFPHISLDLMYGLPSQTISAWLRDVERALDLPVDHISAYALGVEPGTRFFGELRRGRIALPEDDVVAEMYERFAERAQARGFRRYEVSNFARPGGESRHNLAYWRYEPYYAAGLGAHGFLRGIRTANSRHLHTYLRRLAPDSGPDLPWVEVRSISRAEAMGEFAFLGLRLAEGVDFERFRRLFGVPFSDVFAPTLARLTEAGVLSVRDGRAYVEERWVYVQNTFLSDFLLA